MANGILEKDGIPHRQLSYLGIFVNGVKRRLIPVHSRAFAVDKMFGSATKLQNILSLSCSKLEFELKDTFFFLVLIIIACFHQRKCLPCERTGIGLAVPIVGPIPCLDHMCEAQFVFFLELFVLSTIFGFANSLHQSTEKPVVPLMGFI